MELPMKKPLLSFLFLLAALTCLAQGVPALEQLKAIQAQGEDDAELWRAIGIAQMKLGDYEDAEESLETALRKSGGVPGTVHAITGIPRSTTSWTP